MIVHFFLSCISKAIYATDEDAIFEKDGDYVELDSDILIPLDLRENNFKELKQV